MLGADGEVVARQAVVGAVQAEDLADHFETIAVITPDQFGASMIERPAIVRTPYGRWRLYVCPNTPGTKHWWIGVLEASEVDALAKAEDRIRTAYATSDDGLTWVEHGTVLAGRPATGG